MIVSVFKITPMMLLMLTKLASQERCCAAGKLAADSDLQQQSGQTAAEKQSTSDGKEQIESRVRVMER